MGPVGGGKLGEPSETIKKLLPKKTVSCAEIALRFVLANPNVDCALSGMSTIEMVEEMCVWHQMILLLQRKSSR